MPIGRDAMSGLRTATKIKPGDGSGRARLSVVHPRHGVMHTMPFKDNLILFDWAAIVGNLLTTGNPNYKIGGMFLEFENVASEGDPVSIPSFDRSGGIAYYDSLSLSATRDYLRVPLISGTLESIDEVNFPDGNLMTFFAQSQGTVGVHGKEFSDTAISKVFGGALVAMPDINDSTQDKVFSRFYVETSDQQVKLATSQIGLTWEIELG
jgi:hypothetical protein